tara:strand:+ start:2977 stop:4482 length:1506 start_codon:yes stop_codon:yes gene_type:complete
MPEINIILGPPGTGKTHNLLNLVEKELANGTSPDRIGFFAFTKKAAMEAKDRAKKKFNLDDKQLPFFRTLHSLAFLQLGLTTSEVMSRDNYKEFAQAFGMDLGSVTDGFDSGGIITTDNRYINEINLSKMKGLDLGDHYNKSNLDVSWHALLRAQRSFEEYKSKREVLDFTDMLELFIQTSHIPQLDVVFIDEAQDLSWLQWSVASHAWNKAKKVYISGDDDQAIFRWAGADIEYFIKMQASNITVLNQSYRCPRLIHKMADKIIQRVGTRRPKEWKGRDYMGQIRYHAFTEGVDLRDGEWLVMARTNYLLDEIERQVKTEGLLYRRNNKLPISQKLLNAMGSWKKLNEGQAVELADVKDIYSYMSTETGIQRGHKNLRTANENKYEIQSLISNHGLLVAGRPWDVAFDKVGNRDKEYLRAIEQRNGSDLKLDPKINLSTIHAAKGGEAQNVMLLTDLTRKTQESMEQNPDDESRVFYVGITRAKESLHIVQPQREGGFII